MSDLDESRFITYLRRFAAGYREQLIAAWDQPREIFGPRGPFSVDERSQGLYATWPPQSDLGEHTSIRRIKMTPDKGREIADHYEAARHRPDDPLVAASYRQLIGEVYTQYRFATEHLEITFESYSGSGEPYESSRAMRWDLLASRHLYVLPTGRAFGSGTGPADFNWMRLPTDLMMSGTRLLVNDMFRAVHDLFAHAFPGTTFGPTGEERAWLIHSRMCSSLARPALTSETRGQNCWVNFGPHMRGPAGRLLSEGERGWLPQADRPFADQKNGLLPPSASGVRLDRDGRNGILATSVADWSPSGHQSLRESAAA